MIRFQLEAITAQMKNMLKTWMMKGAELISGKMAMNTTAARIAIFLQFNQPCILLVSKPGRLNGPPAEEAFGLDHQDA